MTSEKGLVPPSTGSALAEVKMIHTLEDLFSIAIGNNTSALKHDIEKDGWPDLGDMNDPMIMQAIEDFQDDFNLGDIRSIATYADRVVRDIEGVYSRLSHNAILSMGQMEDESTRDNTKVSMDLSEMMEQLKPFFVTDEELKPGFFSRLFGAKAQERPSPEQILSAVERFSLDINAHQAEVTRSRQNANRTIRSIRAQRDSLVDAMDDAKKAEIQLFIAYYAAMEVFKEWHTEPVRNAYVNVSQFGHVPDSKKPETEFAIPYSPADWHEFTFNLNQRLEHLRSIHFKFQRMQADVPRMMLLVELRLSGFEKSSESSIGGWDKSIKKIRTALELIRTEQRIERLKSQAADVQQTIRSHDQYMAKFENSALAKDTKPESQEVVGRIRGSSKILLEQQNDKAEKLAAQINKLAEARNELRVALGEKPIQTKMGDDAALPSVLSDEAPQKPKSRWSALNPFGKN